MERKKNKRLDRMNDSNVYSSPDVSQIYKQRFTRARHMRVKSRTLAYQMYLL